MAKREYSEARYRANKRYDDKTYQTLLVRLRLDEDAEIINAIEKAKADGISYREWLRSIYYK